MQFNKVVSIVRMGSMTVRWSPRDLETITADLETITADLETMIRKL